MSKEAVNVWGSGLRAPAALGCVDGSHRDKMMPWAGTQDPGEALRIQTALAQLGGLGKVTWPLSLQLLVYETIWLTYLIGLLRGSKWESIMKTVKYYAMKDIISVITGAGLARALLHPESSNFLLSDASWLLLNITNLCCIPRWCCCIFYVWRRHFLFSNCDL